MDALKTEVVVIADEGRDKGKAFLLKEMPAAQAEKWATRALQGLVRSGTEIDYHPGIGMAGIAMLGLKALAGIDWALLEPLMDEAFACVTIIPDPERNPTFSRKLVENDILEVMTRVHLRAKVWTMHTGFFFPASASTSTSETPPQA